MITDTCLACGKRIYAVTPNNRITLEKIWTHGGTGWTDRRHHPIPSDPKLRAKSKINGRPL